MKLSGYDFERVDKYFSIAENVFDRGSDLCGLQVEVIRQLIASAFFVAPNGIVATRIYKNMIKAGFLYVDVTGIHANATIKKQHIDFRLTQNFQVVE